MAAAGYAPALLGFEQVVQGWWLIVQEFVDAAPWDEMVDKPVEALKAAVRALHAAGFVHGDLRAYPYFMNHADIQWPDGAGDGRLVTESHDLW